MIQGPKMPDTDSHQRSSWDSGSKFTVSQPRRLMLQPFLGVCKLYQNYYRKFSHWGKWEISGRNSWELEGVSKREKNKISLIWRYYKSMAKTEWSLRQSLLRLINLLDYHGQSQWRGHTLLNIPLVQPGWWWCTIHEPSIQWRVVGVHPLHL